HLELHSFPTRRSSDLESDFSIKTSKGNYRAKKVILSLGFYVLPYLLNVPGENLPKVKHYYDEPHPYFAQKIIVVGAANSAVDVEIGSTRLNSSHDQIS